MSGLSLTKCEATIVAIAGVCIERLELGNFLSEIDSISPRSDYWKLRLKGRTDIGTEVEVLAAMEFSYSVRSPYNFTDARVHVSYRKLDGRHETHGANFAVTYLPETGIEARPIDGSAS